MRVLHYILFAILLSIYSEGYTQHQFFFDTHQIFDNTLVEEVSDTQVLTLGKEYCVTVSGTYSPWPEYWWTAPCGNPEPMPMYPSVNNTNGNTAADFEYKFAAPTPNACAGVVFPQELVSPPRMEISLDNGTTWFHPSTGAAYNPNHIYQYTLVGQGFPLMVRHNDVFGSDNYGLILFDIMPCCATVVAIDSLFSFPSDTTLCEGERLDFLVDDTLITSAIWNNIFHTNVFEISTPGQYWVEMYGACTDTLLDTILVDYVSAFEFDLGPDTTLCAGDTLFLQAPANLSSFMWGDGSQSTVDTIDQSGAYTLLYTDLMGCENQTSITADFIRSTRSDSSIWGFDTLWVCKGELVQISAPKYDEMSYMWSDGSNDLTVQMPDSGMLFLQMQDRCGILKDTLYTRPKKCYCNVFVPNTIRPNTPSMPKKHWL